MIRLVKLVEFEGHTVYIQLHQCICNTFNLKKKEDEVQITINLVIYYVLQVKFIHL